MNRNPGHDKAPDGHEDPSRPVDGSDERRTERLPEQPLAEDETTLGGIEGAVGGGQSGQGGG